jgi:PAS domain S-box-containing protein
MEKAKILIVEDEAITAKDIHDRLQDLNYAPAIALSGEQAIKQADAIKPDLVLMDIILKGMDGIEAAELIRDRFDIPIVYFSAYIDEERLQKTKVTEPFGYLIKPYDDNELRPTIEIALQRDKLEKALRESEERYRMLFNSSNDAVFVHGTRDMLGKIVEVNDTACQKFGYTREELLELSYLDLIAPEQLEEVPKIKEKLLPGGHIIFEITAVTKDGKKFPCEISTHLFEFKGQNTVLSLVRDVTERKKAEEKLEADHEHIRLINKILRHDIINDLNAINSALRLYGRSKKEELLEEASAHVNKSVKLINRMRELEIFISSHSDLKLYPVTEVLKEVVASYPAIAFNIEGEGQVLADESLSSVIDNIISNAVVHGKTDSIDIKIEGRGEYCEIRIADYGVGIPEEVKEKIFEEKFAYGETGGTGLGLYIVKKAMETYGGHVRIEDNTPRGTVFVLRLRKVR